MATLRLRGSCVPVDAALASKAPKIWRVAMRRLYFWLGLLLGGLVFISGLSGTALVYYTQIDDALVPELRKRGCGTPPCRIRGARSSYRPHQIFSETGFLAPASRIGG